MTHTFSMEQTRDEPAWLVEMRQRAADEFTRQGLPARKQEDWRYTRFDGLQTSQLVRATPPRDALTPAEIDSLCGNNVIRLVIRDGFLDHSLSRLDQLTEGLHIRSLSEALRDQPDRIRQWFGQCGIDLENAFPALNTTLMQDGVFLHVNAGTRINVPVEISYITSDRDAPLTCAPRNLVVLEQGAQLTLVEHFAHSDCSTAHFTDAVTEIHLADDAQLTHYRLQNTSAHAFHIDHVYCRQSPGSRYQALSVQLGGKTARTEFHTSFTAPGAHCDLKGIYLAGDQQVTDIHTKTHHSVPGCHSEQHFKGIVTGKGRAVFDGLIKVARDAQQTAAHLKNDNLLLSRDAEIDTKPQLEIFADDVQCSHGATVGQLDPEHLFYLRSRGIDRQQAYRMLCLGFAGEILEGCQIDAFRERVITEVSERLNTSLDMQND